MKYYTQEDLKRAFRDEVKRLRHLSGYTPTELAEKAKMCKSHVWKLENTTSNPCLQSVIRIAEAFDLTPVEFVTAVENRAVRYNTEARIRKTGKVPVVRISKQNPQTI